MIFIAAKPATASALARRRLSKLAGGSSSPRKGSAGKPSPTIALCNVSLSIKGSWDTRTRLVVKLTRASITPGSAAKAPSSLEMQPAHRKLATLKTAVSHARPALSVAGAFTPGLSLHSGRFSPHFRPKSAADSGLAATPWSIQEFQPQPRQSEAAARAGDQGDG